MIQIDYLILLQAYLNRTINQIGLKPRSTHGSPVAFVTGAVIYSSCQYTFTLTVNKDLLCPIGHYTLTG